MLPILDIYRKYYGWKLAAYIAAVLFATMALTGVIVDLLFNGLNTLFPAVGFIPAPNHHFIALAAIAWFVYQNRRHPMRMGHDKHDMAGMTGVMDDAPQRRRERDASSS